MLIFAICISSKHEAQKVSENARKWFQRRDSIQISKLSIKSKLVTFSTSNHYAFVLAIVYKQLINNTGYTRLST